MAGSGSVNILDIFIHQKMIEANNQQSKKQRKVKTA